MLNIAYSRIQNGGTVGIKKDHFMHLNLQIIKYNIEIAIQPEVMISFNLNN